MHGNTILKFYKSTYHSLNLNATSRLPHSTAYLQQNRLCSSSVTVAFKFPLRSETGGGKGKRINKVTCKNLTKYVVYVACESQYNTLVLCVTAKPHCLYPLTAFSLSNVHFSWPQQNST